MTFVGPTRCDLDIKIPNFKWANEVGLRKNRLEILAFDPGGTTGWSLLVLPVSVGGTDVWDHPPDMIVPRKVSWKHGEISSDDGEDEAVFKMGKICASHPAAAIVVEDFILRAERKEKGRDLLSPVRITAKLETYLWRMGREMFLQNVGQVKPVMTNDRLSIWNVSAEDGLPDHARDADRHALFFMRRCLGTQGLKVRKKAWPHIYEDG